MVQEREDGGFALGGSDGDGNQWVNLISILQVELREGLDCTSMKGEAESRMLLGFGAGRVSGYWCHSYITSFIPHREPSDRGDYYS